MTVNEQYDYSDISKMIDHALLKPSLTLEEIERGIETAVAYDVASVCIMPSYLSLCASRLSGTNVLPGTVIGFPHGGHSPEVKRYEAECALADGAAEIDVVLNISRAVCGDINFIEDEVAPIVALAHAASGRIKLIFENCYLSDTVKIQLCVLSSRLGTDWVKTSTGFGLSGATVADVELMYKNVSSDIQVKASGGIRTLNDLLALRSAGATRIGASATVTILDECKDRLTRS